MPGLYETKREFSKFPPRSKSPQIYRIYCAEITWNFYLGIETDNIKWLQSKSVKMCGNTFPTQICWKYGKAKSHYFVPPANVDRNGTLPKTPFQIFSNVTFYWLLSHIVRLSNKLWDRFSFLWSLFIKITQIATLPDYVTWMFDTRNQERELRKIVHGRLLVVRGAPSAESRKQIWNHLKSKTPQE